MSHDVPAGLVSPTSCMAVWGTSEMYLQFCSVCLTPCLLLHAYVLLSLVKRNRDYCLAEMQLGYA